MSGLKDTTLFVARCIVAGLAIACVAILLRPDLLRGQPGSRDSYAEAVAASAEAVVNIYTTRLVPVNGESPSRPISARA